MLVGARDVGNACNAALGRFAYSSLGGTSMNVFNSTGIPGPTLPYSREDRGLAEMSKVWERLFVGGRNDAERLYLSNPYDITTVISLCERPVICLSPFIVYLHVPINDRCPLPADQFDFLIEAIADNIRRN